MKYTLLQSRITATKRESDHTFVVIIQSQVSEIYKQKAEFRKYKGEMEITFCELISANTSRFLKLLSKIAVMRCNRSCEHRLGEKSFGSQVPVTFFGKDSVRCKAGYEFRK